MKLIAVNERNCFVYNALLIIHLWHHLTFGTHLFMHSRNKFIIASTFWFSFCCDVLTALQNFRTLNGLLTFFGISACWRVHCPTRGFSRF
jgi:hypothetical protein